MADKTDKTYPTPWSISPHSAYGNVDICCAGVNGEAGKGGWFMSLSHGLKNDDPQEMFDDFNRQVARIISAVNRDHLFGELVETLAALLDETVDALRSTFGDGPPGDKLEDEPVIRNARALLAKVKDEGHG